MTQNNRLDSLESIHFALMEMGTSTEARITWLDNNKNILDWNIDYHKVLNSFLTCQKQIFLLAAWVQGNIDIDRRVFPTADVAQARLFAKNLRSKMRGTSMDFNALINEANLNRSITRNRHLMREFADTAKRSVHVWEAFRALEVEKS